MRPLPFKLKRAPSTVKQVPAPRRRFRSRWLGASILGLSLFSSSVGLGDIVHLKSGRRIEGSTQPGKKPGTTEVRPGGGTVVILPDDDILRIERKTSPQDEFDARFAKLADGDRDALHALLAFARDKRLSKSTKLVAREILEIDPHDAVARQELGYVVYENRWVLESDLRDRKELVRYLGEWMTGAEKERRIEDDGRKEVDELLDLLDTDNAYVQEFSIRKALARRDAAAKAVFMAHVSDPRTIPRMVAIRGLVHFRGEGQGTPEERQAAADLHRVALEETTQEVLKVLYPTLAAFLPAESFRLAKDTVLTSTSERDRVRAAEVLYYTLRRAFVPELCRAVVSERDGAHRREIRGVLRRALGVDFGFDRDAWLRFWRENQQRYVDD